MANELEIKIRVASHQPVRERLRILGASFLGAGLEHNQIYDRPDAGLRHSGVGLRLRDTRWSPGPQPQSTLTVKGPCRPGPMKDREEIELRVENGADADRALALLGFCVVLDYEKRREHWSYDECYVELDEPPHVGLFVEIEGPDAAHVRRVQSALSLDNAAVTNATYVELLLDYCRQHHLDPRQVKLP